MEYIILVNGKPKKPTDGQPYRFDSIKDAIRVVDISYGLSSLLNDVEITEAK
jgi:hypothetical protein